MKNIYIKFISGKENCLKFLIFYYIYFKMYLLFAAANPHFKNETEKEDSIFTHVLFYDFFSLRRNTLVRNDKYVPQLKKSAGVWTMHLFFLIFKNLNLFFIVVVLFNVR